MDDYELSQIAKALSHPLRIEFLRTLRGRPQLSPSEFADEFEVPLGNAAYHAKALAEAGVLEVAELIPRRGAMEHRYALGGRNSSAAVAVIVFMAAL